MGQESTIQPLEIHQSQISTFLKCGLQYQFRYIDKIQTPSRYYHTVGRAVDAGANFNFSQKVQSEKDMPVQDVLDVVATEFDREAPDVEWMDQDRGAQKDVAVRCAEAHTKILAPSIQPEKVQERFVIETDAGYSLGGTFDLTTKDKWLRDTKTAKGMGSYAVHKAIQPALYDFAYEALYGHRANGFAFDVVKKPTKTKGPETEVIAARVTTEDREWLFQTTNTVYRAINAGIFLPAPEGSWWCSEKWCSYWSRCKGRK